MEYSAQDGNHKHGDGDHADRKTPVSAPFYKLYQCAKASTKIIMAKWVACKASAANCAFPKAEIDKIFMYSAETKNYLAGACMRMCCVMWGK